MIINNNEIIAVGQKVFQGGKSSSHDRVYLLTNFKQNEHMLNFAMMLLCWCDSELKWEEQQSTATTGTHLLRPIAERAERVE